MKTSQRLPPVLCLLSVALPLFAARPVARWDVVPDQRVSGVFHAGVCAFHDDGVAVEFLLNGKSAHVAKAPTLNPRTKVWEYVFPVDTAQLPDGPITLGARAHSLGKDRETYELPDLPLFANGHGTLTVRDVVWVDATNGVDTAAGTREAPLKTLRAAIQKVPVGGTVCLLPGEYSAGGLGNSWNRPYWTTITAAPGVPREAVQIAGGRPGVERLRFHGVTLYCDADKGYAPILAGEQGRTRVLLDDCVCLNRKGRWAANANVFGNRYVAYVLGGVTTELTNGPGGEIIRDHTVEKIASDVWTGSDRLVVNSTCRDVDGGNTGAHPDFHQSHAVPPGWVHDVILYNVTGYNCRCQGLFGGRLRDSAFVNVLMERVDDPKCYFLSQYSGPMENVLFANVTLIHQSWLWRGNFQPKDVRVYNCSMHGMSSHQTDLFFDGSGTNGLTVANCFFANPKSVFGMNALSGDPHFADPDAGDYSFRADSPALRNFKPLPCVPADFRGKPFAGQP